MSEATSSFGWTAVFTEDRNVCWDTALLPTMFLAGMKFCAFIAWISRAASCGIWFRIT